ncbi:MAG: hypothetical protein OXE50_01560 [Chloroflexi bacterium]|nr:hypothetical protein [Chloroflexota bacterium]
MEITYGEPYQEFGGTRIDVFLDGECKGYLYRMRQVFRGPIDFQGWRFFNADHHAESDFFGRYEDAQPWIVEYWRAGSR